jgi:homoserine/homoserine lactone efflux protein
VGAVTFLAFVFISIAVLVFPGPSILLIVANSMQRGRIVGLYTVAGGLVAMGAQLLVAVTGLNTVDSVFAAGFNYLRWAGVAYLIYLGAQRWRGHTHGELRGRMSRSYRSAVTEGFIVALTNPGTMLFFVTFFAVSERCQRDQSAATDHEPYIYAAYFDCRQFLCVALGPARALFS